MYPCNGFVQRHKPWLHFYTKNVVIEAVIFERRYTNQCTTALITQLKMPGKPYLEPYIIKWKYNCRNYDDKFLEIHLTTTKR